MATVNFNDFLKEKLKDPEFKKYFDIYDMRDKLAVQVVSLRKSENLSQEELAKRAGLAKSTIARIENSNMDPTIKTMLKIAKAGNKQLKIVFE